MPSARLANLVIFGCLSVTCVDIFTGLEHWPFGSYPMYSLRYSEQLSWLRLYGVTDSGEIPLRGERDFAPFDEARLTMALARIAGAPGGQRKLQEALGNLMRLHDRRGDPRSPALRALRLYRLRWRLQPGMQGDEPPGERILIAESTAAGNAR